MSPSGAAAAPARTRRIAVHLADLNGGGVQRVMLTLAAGFAERGHQVDVLVGDARGPMRAAVSPKTRLVELETGSEALARAAALRADPLGLPRLLPLLAKRRVPGLAQLPAWARELERSRPDALISATPYPNLQAVWARALSGAPIRLLLTEHIPPSQKGRRNLAPLVRRTYLRADAIAAVSRALAEDVARFTGLPRERVRTLYNPVVDDELRARAQAPLDHPWLAPGEPPVVLSVGRLGDQKDFETLVRAFALLRERRPARLVILGSAKDPEKTAERSAALLAEASRLGVEKDLYLPGFSDNPQAWMARAAVYALSSRFEGLPTVLIEAMACGCPVVSTDCPCGPDEILAGGRFGPLVPVGDAPALARALDEVLSRPPDREALRRRAADFAVEPALDAYLAVLFPSG